MGTGVEEVALAESVKGAGEAAALTTAGSEAAAAFAPEALSAWGSAAGIGTGEAAALGSLGSAAGGAGAYASALGAGAGDAALYSLPGAGGAQFAGMSLADLGGVSASLSAADLAAGGAAGAAGGGGGAGEAGGAQSFGVPSSPTPSSIPGGGAADLTGAGLPDPSGTLPDVAGSTAPPTGIPDAGTAPAYGGPGTPGAGAAGYTPRRLVIRGEP